VSDVRPAAFAVADDVVAPVRDALPPPRAVERAAVLFATLSDPGRLRLVTALTVVDELRVTDLAAVAGMRESTTSHALRLLRAHQLVRARRDGRTVFYSLADDHVRHLLHDVLEHAMHPDEH
jgi:ArsR family transcriptional regulator, lead/cadmium/zinc/bismuth-responsive transcriptional repressor